MKTLKITLIAAIVACTMISLANAGGVTENPKFKKVMNISIEKAQTNPGLVIAMHQQINQEVLLHNPGHVYQATVIYQGTTYRIIGTLDQWVKFFTRSGLPPVNKQRGNNLS
jgi:hypothetical protein